MKHKEVQSTETTNYISPRVSMLEPNEVIPVYNGEFILKEGENIITLIGAIRYCWLPDPILRFSGINQGPRHDFRFGEDKALIVNGQTVGFSRLSGASTSKNEQVFDGFCLEATFGDHSKAVPEVYFAVPNLRFFMGEAVEDKESLFLGGMSLKHGNYEVRLNLLREFKKLENELNTKGGYLILGCGVLSMKQKALEFKDSLMFSKHLSIFISFLNSRRADISFLTGVNDTKEVWKHFGMYETDIYLPTISWAQSQNEIDYQSLFTAFMKLREHKSDGDFIRLAIHWYIEANQFRSYVEGAIIFIQTALELIYNWLLIEKRKLIVGDDADRMSASNKIRLILSQLSVSPNIPEQLSALSSVKGVVDGPDIFVKIRNALIHGQEKKRSALKDIPINAKIETLQLGLWYVELSLLYILDYKGNYYNRVSRQSELVPWINSN